MFKPLQNYVLLKKVVDEKKKTMLILPEDVAEEEIQTAIVIDVGETVKLPIKKGDKVMFRIFGFQKIGEYLVGKEDNIFIKC